MKDQLLSELLSIVKGSKESIVKGGSFDVDQGNDIAMQLITYYGWKMFFLVCFFMLLMIVISVIAYKITKSNFWKIKIERLSDAPYSSPGEAFFVLGLCTGVPFVLCSFGLVASSLTLIKIIVAPRLFLIEHISNLMLRSQ